ncbi:O-antigen translocase [Bradyrhizobium ganzhouense]|uniref:O-antigen translocase n=1 Tax=Bradyrhizobium ganzhouense TaxID=1179767 RepID=UPI003CF946FC
MSILRSGALSAIATAARLISGLVIIKLVALFAGPEGVGKFGQFMSLTALLAVLGSGGITTGVAKYVAEYRTDPDKLSRLLGASAHYVLVAACLVSALTFILSAPLSLWLFDDIRYRNLVWALAAAQPAIAAGNYIIAVLNGLMDVSRVATAYVVASSLAVILTGTLAYSFRLHGAILALVLGQAAVLMISLPLIRRSPHFDASILKRPFERVMTSHLAAYSTMTLSSALLSPLVSIGIRNYLAGRFSWEEVGYWQAVGKISEAYLAFFTGWVGVYYLPRLSAIGNRKAFVVELRKAYTHVLPMAAAIATMIYILRYTITTLVFGEQFAAASSLYGPQLLGDVLKVGSQLLAYIMMAKAMKGAFITSEIFFSASYAVLVYFFTDWFGLVGSMYAFAINYALYLVFSVVLARIYILRM